MIQLIVQYTKCLSLLIFVLTQMSCSKNVASNSGADVKTGVLRGHERGNGGDYVNSQDGAAWFLDDSKAIKVCYLLSPAFGLPTDKVEAAIKHGFAKWTDYIHDREVNSAAEKFLRFTVKYQMLPKCDGSEDLLISFGVATAEIKAGLSAFHDPVAAAVRTSYDFKSNWGKGFIWIAPQNSLQASDPAEGTVSFPDWSLSYSLEGMVLHELGHVFGNDHAEGTIMRADLARIIWFPKEEPGRRKFVEIEDYLSLVNDAATTKTFEGELGTVEGRDNRASNFELLMGRKPVGKIKASVTIVSGKDAFRGLPDTLTIGDDRSEFSFLLQHKAGAWMSQDTTNLSVFKRRVVFDNGRSLELVSGSGAWTKNSSLRSVSNGDISVMIDRNQILFMLWPGDNRGFRFGGFLGLRIVHHDRIEPLFSTCREEVCRWAR